MTSCPNCFAAVVHYSEATAESVCTNCGSVLEESAMVSTLQFVEGGGGVHMTGEFVNSSGRAARYSENHELVLERGRNNIQAVADLLNLTETVVEAANRIYALAVQRSFTVGRINMHVAAACLYAICRRTKVPSLLLDFSDALLIPVRSIGQVFLKLQRLCHVAVPPLDASILVQRFVKRLELGHDQSMVESTAVKLVTSMTRDWISTGRRPTGVVGAAILIAARVHGVPLASLDLAPLCRISCATLEKRLVEFKRTPTAALTADEFDQLTADEISKMPLKEGILPPCTIEQSKRSTKPKIQRNLAALLDGLDELEGSIYETKLELEFLPSNLDGTPDLLKIEDNELAIDILQQHDIEDLGSDLGFETDSEIEDMLLDEEERRVKELIWDELTKDVMPGVHERLLKRQREEVSSKGDKASPKKRKPIPALPEAETPMESVRLAFNTNGLDLAGSIREDAIESLFNI